MLVHFNEISECFSSSWLQDRPDLQIEDFGIEVTTAYSEKSAASDAYANKMLGAKDIEIAKKLQTKNRNSKEFWPAPIAETGRYSIEYSVKGYDGETKSMHRIVECINNKQNKWNNGYKFCKSKGLYIRVEDDLLGNPNHEFRPECILNTVTSSIFDVVYFYLCPIYRNHYLFSIKKSTREIRKYVLDQDCRDLLAKRTACELML